jgi:hypothetical protein
MGTFKVKYATRNKLAKSLQREIRSLGLVDTGALYDSIRISAVSSQELNKLDITINAVFYYFFLDDGTVNMPAFNITDNWLAKQETKQIVAEIVEQFIKWQLQEYPLLNMAKILNNPKVNVFFNWIDDPYGLPTASYSLR